jgi:ribosomal protein S27E
VIDKSKKFWSGDCAEDIIEYLNEYTQNEVKKIVIVKCNECGLQDFTFQLDDSEGAIEVTCVNCNKKRLLLDSEDYWDDCEPEEAKCSVCKKDFYNIGVGFVYRDDGDVKWVYIGNRCINCGVLGSWGDWKIDYDPTDNLEKNI